MLRRFSEQTPTALRTTVYTQTKDLVRGLRGTHRRAAATEGDVWGDGRGKGYSGGQEWDWMKGHEEDLKAFGVNFEGWLAQGRTEGRQMVPTGRGRGGGLHGEMTQSRGGGDGSATQYGCSPDSITIYANTRAREEKGVYSLSCLPVVVWS